MDDNADDKNRGEFGYGREVLKEGSYDKFLQTPYAEFPLFSRNSESTRTTS